MNEMNGECRNRRGTTSDKMKTMIDQMITVSLTLNANDGDSKSWFPIVTPKMTSTGEDRPTSMASQ